MQSNKFLLHNGRSVIITRINIQFDVWTSRRFLFTGGTADILQSDWFFVLHQMNRKKRIP